MRVMSVQNEEGGAGGGRHGWTPKVGSNAGESTVELLGWPRLRRVQAGGPPLLSRRRSGECAICKGLEIGESQGGWQAWCHAKGAYTSVYGRTRLCVHSQSTHLPLFCFRVERARRRDDAELQLRAGQHRKRQLGVRLTRCINTPEHTSQQYHRATE